MTKKYFILALCLLSCINNENHAPLFNAVRKIESSWTEEELEKFKNLNDSSNLNTQFEYGLYIRNNILRNNTDSTLTKYFHDNHVHHLDDMSYIILTTLHRRLNNNNLKIEKQFQVLYDNQSKTKILENKNNKRVSKYYNKHMVGDTILVRMPVSNNSAFEYGYPEENNWIYNDNFDLLVQGLILEKEKNKFYGKVFHIKVLSMNRENVKILYEDVRKDDEITINLESNIIENTKTKKVLPPASTRL